GQTNTIKRLGVGQYQVRLPGLGGPGGSVKVTAYGGGSHRCKVAGLNAITTDEFVYVHCFNVNGAPVDAYYTSTSPSGRGLLDSSTGSAYAGGYEPTTTSYTPSGPTAASRPRGPISILRYAAGGYTVTFGGVGDALGGDVQVTAYGTDA